MTQEYNQGNVYKLTGTGFYTYVIIVKHITEDKLGFKSIVAEDKIESIGIDVLNQYTHEFVCRHTDKQFRSIILEMESDRSRQLHIWSLFQPEGHYNSDLVLLELSRKGVVTSRTNTLFE
jgi:hypothetical protein